MLITIVDLFDCVFVFIISANRNRFQQDKQVPLICPSNLLSIGDVIVVPMLETNHLEGNVYFQMLFS